MYSSTRYTISNDMDFLDPKKKKAHRIRLYLGYFLMAIALSIGTLILLYEVSGYDYDRKTGTVIQNGLVFVDSHPEQSQIYVNGKAEGETDTRLTLPSGQYEFEMRRNGYRTWKRSFNLEGSSVERLNYAFMFPDKLESTDAQLYASAPKFSTQSPDRRWLLVQKPGSLADFDMIDLNSDNDTVTGLTVPQNLLAAAAGEHSLEEEEWSTDNRHVLLKHTYQGGFEYIMLDREQPSQSINITKTLNIPITEVAMRDKKFDQLHILDGNGGILRFANTKTKEMTILARRVLAFKSYGDDVILYVTEEGAPADKSFVNVRKGENIYKLRELPKAKLNLVDLTRFDDRWYMAVATDADNKTYIYEEPFEDITRQNPRIPAPVAVLRLQKLEHLSISANTRFTGVQGGSEFATYDAEHNRTYRYDTGLKLAPAQKAYWMDGHRYVIESEKQTVVFDYDGINLQKLTNAVPGLRTYFDRDYDNIYNIGTSTTVKDKPALLKTPVRTSQDL